MSETNQAESVSVNAVLPGMSALGINPTATSVAVDIGNLLEDETISEEENENKYTDDKKDISELVQSSYIHMDAEFQKYLENFNETVKKNEEQKFKLKKYFFYCVMIILFLVIIFPYILVFVFHEKVTDVTVITMGISSTAEVVSSIIVLPKIIAKYLFNKKEEDNKRQIISNMQTYNHDKQNKSKYVIIRICQQLYFSDTLFS